MSTKQIPSHEFRHVTFSAMCLREPCTSFAVSGDSFSASLAELPMQRPLVLQQEFSHSVECQNLEWMVPHE